MTASCRVAATHVS